MTVDDRELADVLERFPYWFHALRNTTPAQVAGFAAAMLAGTQRFRWPEDGAPEAVIALQDAPWDTAKLGVNSM